MSVSATQGGISLGSAIAVVLSWNVNHSIFWMAAHGACSWFYVTYHWLRYL